MLADFFTKPLNGALFKKFKAVIMGHAHISTLLPSSEERVENTDNEKADKHNNVKITFKTNSVNDAVTEGKRSYLQVLTHNLVRSNKVA